VTVTSKGRVKLMSNDPKELEDKVKLLLIIAPEGATLYSYENMLTGDYVTEVRWAD
jgi:hypothetical protein